MAFASDGTRLVTCGDCHAQIWNIPTHAGPRDRQRASDATGSGEVEQLDGSVALSGLPVELTDKLQDAVFVDVVCERAGDGWYCVTSAGVLCSFSG